MGRQSSEFKEEKEIQEGIKLIKQMRDSEQGKPKVYVFMVQVDRLNTIEFIADFSDSRNVVMKQPIRPAISESISQEGRGLGRNKDTQSSSQGKDSVKYIDLKGLKQTTIIQPYSNEIIAELQLNENWELKSKLKYIIKPAPKEKQRQAISSDESMKMKEIRLVVPKMSKLPLSLLTTGETIALLEHNLKEISKTKEIQQNTLLKFIDPEFLPIDYSVFGEKYDDSIMDTLIQWRRPKDIFKPVWIEAFRSHQSFLYNKVNERLICVFQKNIYPHDIIPGQLGDFWILSALATLAERPQLIRRLFLTPEVNEQGFYRVKICKNGEWQTIGVDDYFPCNPLDSPIFSFAENFQLWVLILEKAYAKLHGNYFALKAGFCENALMDLTGCPVEQFDLQPKQNDNPLNYLENLWITLGAFQKQYIMNVVPGDKDQHRDSEYKNDNESYGLQAGHAYAIIKIVDYNGNKLFNIRDVWEKFAWDGEWSNKSTLWDKGAQKILEPQLGDPKQFWISLEHLQQHFKWVNVCKVKNWDEVRVKGKFVKVEDINDDSIEVFMSKWYYQFEITKSCFEESTASQYSATKNMRGDQLNSNHQQKENYKEIIITLHQEDDKIRGVQAGRPYLDVSLACFRLKDVTAAKDGKQKREKENFNYELFHHTKFDLIEVLAFKNDRQTEITLQVNRPGVYIILPRTNGLGFKDTRGRQKITNLIRSHKEENQPDLTEITESTIIDIFRKFDMLLTRKMTHRQFKAFLECTKGEEFARNYSEKDFEDVLNDYPSFELGLSQQGFLQYFRDKICRVGKNSAEQALQMFNKIGYDESLYSVRSRCFILSFHFENEIEVVVRDAVATDLDLRASRYSFYQQAKEKDKLIFEQDKVSVFYRHYRDMNYSSFFAINQSQFPQEVEINLSKSYPNNCFSSGKGTVKKRIEFEPHRPRYEQTNIELLLHMKGSISSDQLNNIYKYLTVQRLFE